MRPLLAKLAVFLAGVKRLVTAVLPTSRDRNRRKDLQKNTASTTSLRRGSSPRVEEASLRDEQIVEWLTTDEESDVSNLRDSVAPPVLCSNTSEPGDAAAEPQSASTKRPAEFAGVEHEAVDDAGQVALDIDETAACPGRAEPPLDAESVVTDQRGAPIALASQQPGITNDMPPADLESLVVQTDESASRSDASNDAHLPQSSPIPAAGGLVAAMSPIPSEASTAEASPPLAEQQESAIQLPADIVVPEIEFEDSTCEEDQRAERLADFVDEPDDRTPLRVETTKPRPRTASVPRSEDSEEYVAAGQLPDLPSEYAAWNRGLAAHCLLRSRTDADQYLCITPTILSAIMGKISGADASPQQAEAAFTSAVRTAYHCRVLGHNGRLRTLRRYGGDGIPECVAFLAATVLAAYRMHSDEDAAGHAYYVRLAELLECEISGTYPVGFNPLVFESLWVFLRNWLERTRGTRLAAPNPSVDLRRYVALPLAHVPLRSLDIDKLPSFFAWAGYLPRSVIHPDRLLSDLQHWDRARSGLSPAGVMAIADDRRTSVAAQVAAELDTWDGSAVESISRRSAVVEITLDIVQRRPALAFLPRRPKGFPDRFNDGERVFDAADEGWYDPAPITRSDGPILANGFEWKSTVNGGQLVLRRPTTRAIVLAPSEYSGFMSTRELPRGVRSAVMCRDEDGQSVADYLSDVSQISCRPINDPTLPDGWKLFTSIVAHRIVAPPTGLEVLSVGSNTEIVASGGLRLGRSRSWLAGSPPRIFATGMDTHQRATVNGIAVDVTEDGCLQTDGLLNTAGVYLIEASGAQERIEVVEPAGAAVADGLNSPPLQSSNVAVVLPPGKWTLLGCQPGQIVQPQFAYAGGVAAKCEFEPAFAIQVGAGPGAVVLLLEGSVLGRLPVSADSPSPLHRDVFKWASLIYAAHIRRPKFRFISAELSNEQTAEIWGKYVAISKGIKRRNRKQ